MKTTFADLGIPFPLYEAPVSPSDDSDYAGKGTCCVCGANAHCFHLGIGAAFVIPCPSCGAQNGVDVDDKADAECRACGATVPYPPNVATRKEPKVCYACLRAGKAAITKDTEFGMVSCNEAVTGVTNGVPGLRQDQFESVVVDPEDDWVGARLPEEIMLELIRTPTYGTWQGECWLFCCRYPMTFVGEWHNEQFDAHAADGNGEALYYLVVENVPPETWDALGQGLSVYVFECKRCGKLRAHFDSD
jgi:uncharacterized protein CbrC (UPF0167 family)